MTEQDKAKEQEIEKILTNCPWHYPGNGGGFCTASKLNCMEKNCAVIYFMNLAVREVIE